MKLLRTLSLPKLIALALAVVAVAIGGTALAMAARGNGPTPPQKPLAQAIHDSLAAPEPSGITARVKFTNKLFPTGALEGKVGSALMSGADGRLWLTNEGRGRLELQSDAGDVQIVWNEKRVSIFDASSNTVYTHDLPQHKAGKGHESKSARTAASRSPKTKRTGCCSSGTAPPTTPTSKTARSGGPSTPPTGSI